MTRYAIQRSNGEWWTGPRDRWSPDAADALIYEFMTTAEPRAQFLPERDQPRVVPVERTGAA